MNPSDAEVGGVNEGNEEALGDGSFPEMEAFLASEAARHRQFVSRLIAGGVMGIILGVLIIGWLPVEDGSLAPGIGLVLVGSGVVVTIRGVLGLTTKIDHVVGSEGGAPKNGK